MRPELLSRAELEQVSLRLLGLDLAGAAEAARAEYNEARSVYLGAPGDLVVGLGEPWRRPRQFPYRFPRCAIAT